MRPQPVTPGATPAARDLLDLLGNLGGGEVLLSGQHNQPVHGSAWTDWATETGGTVPALWGQDLGFSAPGTLDGVDRRGATVEEAVAWHRRGAVVCLTWHAVCPLDDEPVEFEGGVLRSVDEGVLEEVLRPGSDLHARWSAQVDVAARVLLDLQGAGVPVLWRPYHEMNGPWFWWGGRPQALRGLWRQLFERLVHHHGLRNLVWAWNPNSAYDSALPFAPFHPGDDVVDVLAVDTYGGHWEQEHYEELLRLAGGRPVGLGEVGELPSADVLAAQPRWGWSMAWPGVVAEANSGEEVLRLYEHERVLGLADLERLRSARR